jgi:hypothetical protein
MKNPGKVNTDALGYGPGKKRVGVAENPRSGVGARGSSVKKAFHGAKNLPRFSEPMGSPFLTC